MSVCEDCSSTATNTCATCAKHKCATHMIQVWTSQATGLRVGPYAVIDEGHRPASVCIACRDSSLFSAIDALDRAGDLLHVDQALTTGLPSQIGSPSNNSAAVAWTRAATNAWRRIVSSGVLGPPTCDVLSVAFHEVRNKPIGTETGRESAWLVKDSGEYEAFGSYWQGDRGPSLGFRLTDLWVAESGAIYAPWRPGSREPQRWVGAVTGLPGPRWVVVEPGHPLKIRRKGMYYERSSELAYGTFVAEPEISSRQSLTSIVRKLAEGAR